MAVLVHDVDSDDATRLESAVQRTLGLLAGDGGIDLPPESSSPVDQQSLRGLASMYLASELETAGLVPAVEALAGAFESGGLVGDVGPAGAMLVEFWRTRSQRFTAAERQAFFGRLFGETAGPTLAGPGGRNADFEGLMINLTEAIHNLYPTSVLQPGSGSDAGVRAVAQELAANLMPRASGMADFAGKEVLRSVHDAIQILKVPQLQLALSARSLWGAVQSVAASAGHTAEPATDHVERGEAGMVVLNWLADVLPQLSGFGGTIVPNGSPVLEAATTWLQSSLALAERHAPRPQA